MLSYLCYSYKVYKARKQLAAIDWNFHMNLEAAITKAGQQIVTRKYNQRTKDWDVKIITVKKQFQYITVMMAKIFNMRKEDVDMVTRQVFLNESVRADLNLVRSFREFLEQQLKFKDKRLKCALLSC